MVKESKLEDVTVPEETKDVLNRTLNSIEQLESQLPQFLSLSDPELLSESPLLQRAHSLFSLAKLTSTLFALKLRCRGINPNDHPFKSELDRVSKCQKRLENIPHLTEEQWQDLMNMSRGEGPEMNYQEQAGQKRKYPSSEEQSVQTAKEFHSTGMLLGDNSGSSSKEALVIDISDDDDDDDVIEYM